MKRAGARAENKRLATNVGNFHARWRASRRMNSNRKLFRARARFSEAYLPHLHCSIKGGQSEAVYLVDYSIFCQCFSGSEDFFTEASGGAAQDQFP
jgi:hypothetical protein